MNAGLRYAIAAAFAASVVGCVQSPSPPKQVTAQQVLASERTPYRVPAGHPELRLLHTISATLEIELTQSPVNIGNSANLRALPTAGIKHLAFTAKMIESPSRVSRPLTAEDLSSVAFSAPKIRLRGIAGDPIEHTAPNGKFFTLEDMLRAIEATERSSRERSEWFGGIDIHHIYFEGLVEEVPGVWTVGWGS